MRSILFFFLLTVSFLPAQNLVPNPGFEKYKKIPVSFCHNSKEFTGMVANWTLPNMGTSDYFNALSKANASTSKNNFVGFQKPQEGSAYCGIYAFEQLAGNYRECLQVKLLKPLVAGQQYAVTYYVSLAEASEFAIDRLGAAFYKKQVKQSNSQNIAGGAMAETPDSVFFDSKTNWMLVRLLYTAKGGEQYLVIGNFRDAKEMHTKNVGVNKKKYYKENGAYYYIDNVCVSQVIDGKDLCPCADTLRGTVEIPEPDTLLPEVQLPLDVPLVFHGVNFDTDKSILKPGSFPSLDSVAYFLLENPEYTIAISGHTDDAGNEKHNVELSEARAKAVADYFISKGISADRISYKGYGSSRPVADNATEEGRAKNRRVEYTLAKK